MTNYVDDSNLIITAKDYNILYMEANNSFNTI